jgi:hypothetical protein
MEVSQGKKIPISTEEKQLLSLGAAMISFQHTYPHQNWANDMDKISVKLYKCYADAFSHYDEMTIEQLNADSETFN